MTEEEYYCAEYQEDGADKVSKVLIERILEYANKVPESEWDELVLPSVLCEWKLTNDLWDGDSYWKAKCGEDFKLIEGSPKENSYNFCPNCGGRIKQITTDKTTDK